MINRLKYYLLKINLLRFIYNRLKYNLTTGDFVHFKVNGILSLLDSNIIIRDFSEIVVNRGGELELNKGVFLGKNIEIGADQISIGINTSIQNNCILLGRVNIGSNCLFGPSVYVSSGHHYFKYKPELLIRDQDMLARNELDLKDSKIIIEDDVWIGKNVVIINNIIIGKGSIIGANSMINKNVEPYSIVAGSPQKVIGKRLEFYKDIPIELSGKQVSCFPYFYSGFDYSLESINKNSFVTLVKNKFSIYIKNINFKKILTIEFVNIDYNTVIIYKKESVIVLNNIAKFNLGEECGDKYIFEIVNFKENISIKKVYFENK